MIRVIIAGSRNFNDYDFLRKNVGVLINAKCTITNIPIEDIEIIHGDARGADRLAGMLAQKNNLKCTVFQPDWQNLGRKAGFFRNKDMAKYAAEVEHNMLIAFWNGESKGTKSMIDLGLKYLKNVYVIKY